jgi:alpha-galactosidase/6-phospho-beta-glucosidase family protein
LFDGAGVHPLASPMPEVLRPLILPTILRQERVVDVTLNGNFDELAAVFFSDPLCSRLHPKRCREMVKELMLAQKQFIRNPRLLEFS